MPSECVFWTALPYAESRKGDELPKGAISVFGEFEWKMIARPEKVLSTHEGYAQV